MNEVGIRALKQNASQVVASVAAGNPVTVTMRGRPVAELVPLSEDRLGMLVATGRARSARRDLTSLTPPAPHSDVPSLTSVVLEERRSERY
ncbi:MAG: type II toxin-antitoxin system prevent-host-death family antitoxin [Dehalococcoidia bacterium]|nr:type II toxin-antitoxin system prevent-host-death family antitoxin [Dehalococcoidia bacterium]